jgi:hypothetical protein
MHLHCFSKSDKNQVTWLVAVCKPTKSIKYQLCVAQLLAWTCKMTFSTDIVNGICIANGMDSKAQRYS